MDGLIALGEIKEFEDLKENTAVWGALGQDQQEQQQSNYDDKCKKAKGNLQLSNMVIELMSKVTAHCQEPFISEELGEKFAIALNYCLDQLTTERGLKIKVKNPERFYFEPKGLLVNIIQMYSNMSSFDQFRKNVIADDRSYKSETFSGAIKICEKRNIPVDEKHMKKFQELVS